MAGYDDPRYLQQKIEALEKRLKTLEGSALQMAANQKGALPGQFRANMIGDDGLAASMFINLMGNMAGVSPRLSVRDATKTVRAELGNLAANGNSPAQFGFRANDASGNPIFDSLGLIKALTVMGSATAQGSGSGVTGTGAWQTVSGASVTINPTRTVTVLVLSSMLLVANTLGDSGYTLQGAVLIDGSYAAGNGPACYNTDSPGAAVSMTPFAIVSLAAGSHTVALGVNMTNTHTWAVGSGTAYIYALQLGS